MKRRSSSADPFNAVLIFDVRPLYMKTDRMKLRIALVTAALAFLGATLYVLRSWDRFVNVHEPLPFLIFAAGVLVVFTFLSRGAHQVRCGPCDESIRR
jgi:zinc transporter ZupT